MPKKSSSSGGLNGGAIAGIVIGVVFGVAIGVYAFIYFKNLKARNNQAALTTFEPMADEDGGDDDAL